MAARVHHGDEDLDELHEINVTPFIDVMLVLLIIFMIAAPLATVDISVNLPAANAEPSPRPDKPLFLTLKADLSVDLGNDAVNRAGLAAALDQAAGGDKEQRVFLRADKTVPYGDLMALMNELRSAGYLHVALVGLGRRQGGAVSARVKDIARWGLCFALVLGFHAAGAAALLAHWSDDADLVANAPVITIELAPMAVAPQTQPMELPPGPEQTEAKSEPEPQPQKPVETHEIKPTPANDAEFTVAPPKPPEKTQQKPARKQASLTSAPSAVEQKAERAAAPAPGALSHNSNALPNWKSALVSHLDRYKRYPSRSAGARRITASPSSPSASTAAAACTTRASCAAPARPRSTARRSISLRVRSLCRRRRRKFTARRSRSWFRSVTACADAQFLARQTFD